MFPCQRGVAAVCAGVKEVCGGVGKPCRYLAAVCGQPEAPCGGVIPCQREVEAVCGDVEAEPVGVTADPAMFEAGEEMCSVPKARPDADSDRLLEIGGGVGGGRVHLQRLRPWSRILRHVDEIAAVGKPLDTAGHRGARLRVRV